MKGKSFSDVVRGRCACTTSPGYGGMSVPAWRLKSECFADESFYAFDTEDGGLRAYLEKVTPREFAWRGLHLGPNMRQRARRRRRCCQHDCRGNPRDVDCER